MSATVEEQIRPIERMSANAFCATSLERGRGYASQDVHAMGDWFKVIDPHTAVVPTDVVQLCTDGQGPAQQRPDPHMRRSSLCLQHGLRVAVPASCEPAPGDIARSREVDLFKQALRKTLVVCGYHLPKDTSSSVVSVV
jgi:hypothetical protein